MTGNLTELLTEKQRQAGYTLSFEEDYIHVYFEGKYLSTFSSHRQDIGAISESINNKMIADGMKDVWANQQSGNE
jgi:hypothetical protein